MTKKQKLFAFWQHDKFPYVLGAEIKEFVINPNYQGYIKAVGFGNYFFLPIAIFPIKYGQQICAQLESLKESREADLESIRNKYEETLKINFPQLCKI